VGETKVKLEFGNEFEGTLLAGNGTVDIGRQEGALGPYDLLLGALGACYYSTFLDIAKKMRLEFERAEIGIRGVKREEVPTTLKTVEILFTVFGAKGDKGFSRAAELAAKYCSVHETVSKVAEINLHLELV